MRLPFELDPQIIHHIIYSQAGSIGKAHRVANELGRCQGQLCASFTDP